MNKNTGKRIAFYALIVLLAAVLRLAMAGIPNFSPIGALALFGGAFFMRKRLAIIISLVGLLLGDLIMMSWDAVSADHILKLQFIPVYLAFSLTVLLGHWAGRKNIARIIGSGIASTLLFFLITNTAVWMQGAFYPMTAEGLLSCWVAGIPFYQYSVAGMAVFGSLFFGAGYLTERLVPNFKLQKEPVSK